MEAGARYLTDSSKANKLHWLPATVNSVSCRPVNQRSVWQKIWGGFLYSVETGQENNFELIPTVKTETRHPVEGSFDNEFLSIYNHCGIIGVMAA